MVRARVFAVAAGVFTAEAVGFVGTRSGGAEEMAGTAGVCNGAATRRSSDLQ